MTYVEQIYSQSEDYVISVNDIATKLREILGDEKVLKVYEDMLLNIQSGDINEVKNQNYKQDEYHYYWVAKNLIEMDRSEPYPDGLSYPSHHWLNGDLWEPLNFISRELNKLHGVYAYSMIIYPNGSCYDTKGFIGITFDSIEDFNHFLWASCYRYIPLSKKTLWRIQPDLGDPDWRETKLKMELHYCDVTVDKVKMEEDFKHFAKCVANYAEREEDLIKDLAD